MGLGVAHCTSDEYRSDAIDAGLVGVAEEWLMSRKRRERRRKLERNGELDEENPSSDSDEEQRADSSSGGESPPHIRHVRKPRDERPKCLRRCGCMPYCCRELRDCLLALILMYWALDRLGQKHGWGKEWFLLQ